MAGQIVVAVLSVVAFAVLVVSARRYDRLEKANAMAEIFREE